VPEWDAKSRIIRVNGKGLTQWRYNDGWVKSHLLASLGHALVEQGYPVLWRSTAQLMQRLLAAKRDLRLPQELAKLDRYACLILDDIGYVQHDQDEMEIRSTIASQLYNAKEPMSLSELQAWLGHKHPNSTQHYTKISPAKLAKSYVDAGYFGRNVRTIEVLIDQEAVINGDAAKGLPWKYYDLGHG
jgi:hypothetical protein